MASTAPIGVFDSGLGGISVTREIHRAMPRERVLYFGDSAHAPYGTKTPEGESGGDRLQHRHVRRGERAA